MPTGDLHNVVRHDISFASNLYVLGHHILIIFSKAA